MPGPGLGFDAGWRLLASALPYLKHVPNFGSSAADAAYSGSAATTLFFDPLNGNNGNPGTAFTSAKKDLPRVLSTNTKYMVAAGRVIHIDFAALNYGIGINTNNIIVSVYDPLTGNEITDQPNPFVRALAGGWVTEAEIAAKYFTLRGQSNDMTQADHFGGVGASSGTGFYCNGTALSGVVIRGACIDGCGFACIRFFSTIRVEDCVLRNAYKANDGAVPHGFALRNEQATDSGLSVARIFVENIGHDCFYMTGAAGRGVQNFRFSDFAVRAVGVSVVNSSEHVDVMQMRERPGDYLVQRGVVEHVQPAPVNNKDGTTAPQGSAFQVGSTAKDPDTVSSGGVIRDMVFAGNHTAINAPGQPGQTRLRVLGYLRRHPVTSANTQLFNENALATYTDCAAVFTNPAHPKDVLFRGVAPTRSNVTEIFGT